MSPHQDVFGLVHPRGEIRRAAVVGMQFLHERAMRPRHLFRRRPALKAQDLVSLVFGYRVRSAPDVTGARIMVTLSCRTPSGKPAVEISL